MTVPKAAPRQPLGGFALLAWVVAAAAAFFLLFFLITAVLRQIPDPIGPRADLFVEGARMTLQLTVVSGLIGLLVGIVAGIMRTSAVWLVRAPASLFIWLIRGTPLLVQILFVYNALPPILQAIGLKVELNEFWSAVIALALNVGAYNAEVIRAGILAVPRGQTEAARSLGLSGAQTMRTVVLPQALRIVVPPLVNNLVALLKDSSLASSIALLELTLAGSRVSSETFQPVPVLTTVACVYLALTTVMTLFTDQLEKRVKIATR
ncbi:amino acid ABC transporter permease [Deinococcus metallilatus]|uniref:Amino acid ABC transporter permease n=1 Tax=Deinococcus metallilatus TaxID=1211322 RepID=A0AAJ5JY42_9DEIO|nr:amino acid ABC transporter permease [Deinococcus metallilatus]MBB5295044.1 polar amino acid transport system permease protein [Deinococcus metallilatus]QBY08773.1 amino acid ABC transporter permease [Deinococcus metallilatus]RXJ10653.1 amino acid ABC transporter permease [Deinococcus metallilatus]TLK26624.1 amino acid ABC transporter permease [Deinococcus metallilatus]GMA14816.1 amino acid ABC transporter permease [Deinococcus metallilatus]